MDVTIHATDIEDSAQVQIEKLSKLDFWHNIAIMPDVHAGNGAVIGFTAKANLSNGIIPGVIGVDVGCGVVAYPLGKELQYSLTKIDKKIRDVISLRLKNKWVKRK